MKILKKDRFITSFSAAHPPAYTVDIGETFIVETTDCYGDAITNENQLRKEINIDYINPATGPIYINDVKKGDTICVEINHITLADFGVMVLYPGMGILGNEVKTIDTRILPLKNGHLFLNEDVQFPVKPMIGVIGTAPETGDVLCETPGDHGGNMDTKYITAGNKVFLPVFHDGALLALGDLHAAMGDGELNGSGVEIGGKVTLKISRLEQEIISIPIVETIDSYKLIASAETVAKACKKGVKIAVYLLQKKRSLSYNDAYRLLSATCDLQISQIVNPAVTVRISIPKEILIEPLFPY